MEAGDPLPRGSRWSTAKMLIETTYLGFSATSDFRKLDPVPLGLNLEWVTLNAYGIAQGSQDVFWPKMRSMKLGVHSSCIWQATTLGVWIDELQQSIYSTAKLDPKQTVNQ